MLSPISCLLVLPLVTMDTSYSNTNSYVYKPYTTSNVIQNYDESFDEEFWIKILKEDYERLD